MSTPKNDNKQVFRVEGFSCASCAQTFERNVKDLSGVESAEVNFGASKITVYGSTSVNELEKAGAFEKLKVRPDHEKKKKMIDSRPTESFFRKHQNVFGALIFLSFGLLSLYINGEDNVITGLSFATSMVIGGHELFKIGFMNLLKLRFDMKTLMTVAVIGAAIIGEWLEGSIVVILFAISEALERFSMDKARNSIKSLMDIAPDEALIRRDNREQLIAVDDIQIGDIMIVKPGQKLAMDGVVIKGHSSINQSAVTGESIPVEKVIDDSVYAGTLNEEGYLEVKVTKLVHDTTLAKVIQLVEDAQAVKAPSQAFIDRFAKYYTPAIMIVAFFVATLPPLFFDAPWEASIYQGLAVLVVGCPCALVISTPVSIVTAIGNAAKNGVLIKGGVYLEEAGRLKAVAFDKTGTLTKGIPEITDVVSYNDLNDGELIYIAATLESYSQHPLASAVLKEAENKQINYKKSNVQEFSSVTGQGIKGVIEDQLYQIGNLRMFENLYTKQVDDTVTQQINTLQNQGKTVLIIGNSKEIMGLIAVADQIRENSNQVIQQLHDLGIKETIMLTGDNQSTAMAIGNLTGVKDVAAELMPEDKMNFVKSYQEKYGRVAMVGDGVNDAPALAASTVGIAMGGAGTDTALETADIALMADDLKKLPYTMKLSRKALWIIKQNITFSLGIKLLALVLVVPGWLTLWIAILADVGATLLVTANGLRLLRVKDKS
ncbi:heavy metal translocating P-type ATPase [Shouchella sp. 1P09AA]|uniref:heavy metal translocating P-type ATPase n=1 Tax=unclassified Shouchella TaxID=2893065 RepID=UPI0039A29CBB